MIWAAGDPKVGGVGSGSSPMFTGRRRAPGGHRRRQREPLGFPAFDELSRGAAAADVWAAQRAGFGSPGGTSFRNPIGQKDVRDTQTPWNHQTVPRRLHASQPSECKGFAPRDPAVHPIQSSQCPIEGGAKALEIPGKPKRSSPRQLPTSPNSRASRKFLCDS